MSPAESLEPTFLFLKPYVRHNEYFLQLNVLGRDNTKLVGKKHVDSNLCALGDVWPILIYFPIMRAGVLSER